MVHTCIRTPAHIHTNIYAPMQKNTRKNTCMCTHSHTHNIAQHTNGYYSLAIQGGSLSTPVHQLSLFLLLQLQQQHSMNVTGPLAISILHISQNCFPLHNTEHTTQLTLRAHSSCAHLFRKKINSILTLKVITFSSGKVWFYLDTWTHKTTHTKALKIHILYMTFHSMM